MGEGGSALAGIAQLAAEATVGGANVVESVHHAVVAGPVAGRGTEVRRTRGITGLVYRSVRGVARLSGRAGQAVLARWAPRADGAPRSRRVEAVTAALNGVAGHHLAGTANPLAEAMSLRVAGRAVALDRASLAAAYPAAGTRVVLLIHGLCMNELQWTRRGHDHGAALSADLGLTPVYVRYNTGLHISQNGRTLAALLQELAAAWPVPLEEMVVVAHSMGGLVMRSACHAAEQQGLGWLARLRKIVFLGTPHHGAPLERAGNRLHRVLAAASYTGGLARLGAIRSAGITDLRFGNVVDADWDGRDRFAPGGDLRAPVPLPRGVECYAAAATTGRRPGDLRDRLLGDGLVPVHSALGPNLSSPERSVEIPAENQWIGYRMGHLDLLSRPEVYARIRGWLER